MKITRAENRRQKWLRKIEKERSRQIAREGWTPEHDDKHVIGQLALAACCYATPFPLWIRALTSANIVSFQDPWPWEREWDKRGQHDPKKRLVIAAALILAELERLDRAEGGA